MKKESSITDEFFEEMLKKYEEEEKERREAGKLFIKEGHKVFDLARGKKFGCNNYEDMHSEDTIKQHNLKLVDGFGFIGLSYAKSLCPMVGIITTEVRYYVSYKNEIYEVERFHNSNIRIIQLKEVSDSIKDIILKFEDILEYAKELDKGRPLNV